MRISGLNYISTRGLAPHLGFEGALMAGLARDGGLYVPERWPSLSPGEIADYAGQSYARVAAAVMRPFVAGAIAEAELAELTEAAYAGFAHPAVAPLVQLDDNLWLLELFHGPTLAFKDLAMQLLGLLMERALRLRAARITILAATSGDTGAAAVEAFKNRAGIDLFVLFPDGRISPAQRKQMTTSGADNVHAIAVRGTFDDCQNLVKAAFNDHAFRDAYRLSAVNSINWARIMAQTVYYFTAGVGLGAPHRPVSFAVPTGNFGDIFAGYVALRMGLPVERLIIATNSNDILARTLASGRYEPRPVVATASPSMDIQLSSNFERLLFEAADRDSGRVASLMNAFAAEGGFTLGQAELEAMRGVFAADRVDEAETRAAIARLHARTRYLADPHTAVGLAAAAKNKGRPATPMIVLATAHPAKFADAIEAAVGRQAEIPARLQAALAGRERYETIEATPQAVQSAVAARSQLKPTKTH
jgi:threonine synthase